MIAENRSIAVLVLVGFLAFVSSHAWAQAVPPAADDKGLLPMIPPDAVFFVEHRGHAAVRDAFEASNLGKMYKDEVITQFVQDSRVQIGKLIMKGMFDSPALKTDPAALQQTLHKVLKPFWNNPAALYMVPTDGKFDDAPGVGLICVMDEKSRAEAKPALESLMQIGVPSAGMGTRQAFKWTTGKLEWNGVAKVEDEEDEFTLSATPDKQAEELKDKSLFMTCWTDKHLLVATSLSAAASMGKAMAKPDANKDKNESLARIMKKTALKDWAFRWFVDGDAIRKAIPKDIMDSLGMDMMKTLGVLQVHGAGGTGGFADNVYTRLSYLDAPGAGEGVMGIIKPGGDYKAGLAMMPRQTTFVLAGQIAPAKTVAMIRAIALAAAKAKAKNPEGYAPPPQEDLKGGATSKPTTEPEPKLDEEAAKVIAQFENLAAATGGNGGVFVTDLQALFAGLMGSGGSAPVGMVLDIKDKAKAAAAIDELIKLSGATEGAPPPPPPPAVPPAGGAGGGLPLIAPNNPPPLAVYRKVAIRRLNGMVRLGILEDRVVLALSDDAFKSAVDAALDKTGGFDPEGPGAKMLQLCGQGSAVFSMDLAVLAKLAWPLLSAAVENPDAKDSFPLASLPSTEKLVSYLGPEVAVFQPDDGGLLVKSRGKIPFATKIIGTYPTLGWFFYAGMSMGHSQHHSHKQVVVPAPPPAVPNDMSK
jgi:hypothetical protein